MNTTFDKKWEKQYQQGHAQRYPWDNIISFFFRHKGTFGPHPRILEVGCGTAGNLYALSKEGAIVTGVDASETAIAYAKDLFKDANLSGDLRVCDFTKINYPENSFDMIIDRGALCNCTYNAAHETIRNIATSTVRGGLFYSQLYSKKHSYYDEVAEDNEGMCHDNELSHGTQLTYYDEKEFKALFADDWEIISLVDVVKEDRITGHIHAELQIIAKRI